MNRVVLSKRDDVRGADRRVTDGADQPLLRRGAFVLERFSVYRPPSAPLLLLPAGRMVGRVLNRHLVVAGQFPGSKGATSVQASMPSSRASPAKSST
jgi:hypothetical protein